MVQVEPYHGREVKPELGPLKMSSSLIRAMEEAEELMKLTPRQRLERCVFQSTRDSSAPTTSADGMYDLNTLSLLDEKQ